MRILLVGDYPPDPRLGSTKVFVKLQEEFRAAGHTCDLLLSNHLGSWPVNRHVRWILGPLLALLAVGRAFRAQGRYDVIDIASAEGLWVGALRRLGLFGRTAIVSRSNGIEHLNYKRMIDDHDEGLLAKPWTRRVYYPLVRLSQVAVAARVADRLILLNDQDREFVLGRRWKPADRIDLVAHGVSAAFLTNGPTADAPRGKGILFCGSWTAVKGVTHLADAFSHLIESGRVTNLTILGGAVPEEEIRSAFAPVARRFLTILDRASEDEVMAAYRAHDALAWPSTYEGFGMVVVEAMSQRLPVVATPAGCAQTLVVDERTGLLVPPRDPVALAAALARMLADPDLRARCAEAAFDLVRGMTWANTADRTLTVYTRALAARSNGH